MGSQIGIGQIGCGYWGRNLLRVLMESEQARVCRVVDLSDAARDYVSSRYPSISTSQNEKDLLDDASHSCGGCRYPR